LLNLFRQSNQEDALLKSIHVIGIYNSCVEKMCDKHVCHFVNKSDLQALPCTSEDWSHLILCIACCI